MSAEDVAPVALFVHRRADHTRRVVDSLRANAEASVTPLIVFADGSRGAADDRAVAEVRSYVRTIEGFASVVVVERDRNVGLAGSITAGVSEVVSTAGRVIVLEDDTVVAPGFLRYMNDGLALYSDDADVASIHGYTYPLAMELPETFFLRGADCWGWATWARAWDRFDPDGAALRERLAESGELDTWDHEGASGLADLLDDQIAGHADSWAVRWSASAFLAGMFTLYPGRSLVHNIGNDGTGEHGGLSRRYDVAPYPGRITVERIPVEERPEIHAALTDFYAGSATEGGARGAARWLAGRLTRDQRSRLLRALPPSLRERLR